LLIPPLIALATFATLQTLVLTLGMFTPSLASAWEREDMAAEPEEEIVDEMGLLTSNVREVGECGSWPIDPVAVTGIYTLAWFDAAAEEYVMVGRAEGGGNV
jgi:hypothetical protein